jgi:hypothetical protein
LFVRFSVVIDTCENARLATSSCACEHPGNASTRNGTGDRATGTAIDANPYIVGGYVARRNFATNRIRYMAPNHLGYYRVYVMAADGGAPQELTGHTPGMPTAYMGMPYWHPSGRYPSRARAAA